MVQLQVDRMVCTTSRRRKDGAVLWQLGGRIIQQGLNKSRIPTYKATGKWEKGQGMKRFLGDGYEGRLWDAEQEE